MSVNKRSHMKVSRLRLRVSTLGALLITFLLLAPNMRYTHASADYGDADGGPTSNGDASSSHDDIYDPPALQQEVEASEKRNHMEAEMEANTEGEKESDSDYEDDHENDNGMNTDAIHSRSPVTDSKVTDNANAMPVETGKATMDDVMRSMMMNAQSSSDEGQQKSAMPPVSPKLPITTATAPDAVSEYVRKAKAERFPTPSLLDEHDNDSRSDYLDDEGGNRSMQQEPNADNQSQYLQNTTNSLVSVEDDVVPLPMKYYKSSAAAVEEEEEQDNKLKEQRPVLSPQQHQMLPHRHQKQQFHPNSSEEDYYDDSGEYQQNASSGSGVNSIRAISTSSPIPTIPAYQPKQLNQPNVEVSRAAAPPALWTTTTTKTMTTTTTSKANPVEPTIDSPPTTAPPVASTSSSTTTTAPITTTTTMPTVSTAPTTGLSEPSQPLAAPLPIASIMPTIIKTDKTSTPPSSSSSPTLLPPSLSSTTAPSPAPTSLSSSTTAATATATATMRPAGKQGKQINISRRKLLPHEQLRNYIEDAYIRMPLAVIVDPSADSLEKTKALWRDALRTNLNIKIVLVSLNASGIPAAYNFNNTQQFLAGLNSIKEHNGGNAFIGIVHASELVPYDSAVFISTATIPPHTELVQDAAITLLKKRIRLYVIWYGERSLSENETQEAVGGILGEVAIRSGGEILHIVGSENSQELEGSTLTMVADAFRGSQEVEIPVDTTLSSLHVKIDAPMRVATLETPNGG